MICKKKWAQIECYMNIFCLNFVYKLKEICLFVNLINVHNNT